MDGELHYVTYDPEELWQAMVTAYIGAGGDLLYPGDEKEMLLRGVQAALVEGFVVPGFLYALLTALVINAICAVAAGRR